LQQAPTKKVSLWAEGAARVLPRQMLGATKNCFAT
jgi:hypothetical protein